MFTIADINVIQVIFIFRKNSSQCSHNIAKESVFTIADINVIQAKQLKCFSSSDPRNCVDTRLPADHPLALVCPVTHHVDDAVGPDAPQGFSPPASGSPLQLAGTPPRTSPACNNHI